MGVIVKGEVGGEVRGEVGWEVRGEVRGEVGGEVGGKFGGEVGGTNSPKNGSIALQQLRKSSVGTPLSSSRTMSSNLTRTNKGNTQKSSGKTECGYKRFSKSVKR